MTHKMILDNFISYCDNMKIPNKDSNEFNIQKCHEFIECIYDTLDEINKWTESSLSSIDNIDYIVINSDYYESSLEFFKRAVSIFIDIVNNNELYTKRFMKNTFKFEDISDKLLEIHEIIDIAYLDLKHMNLDSDYGENDRNVKLSELKYFIGRMYIVKSVLSTMKKEIMYMIEMNNITDSRILCEIYNINKTYFDLVKCYIDIIQKVYNNITENIKECVKFEQDDTDE